MPQDKYIYVVINLSSILKTSQIVFLPSIQQFLEDT